jgi:hypothetical protein
MRFVVFVRLFRIRAKAARSSRLRRALTPHSKGFAPSTPLDGCPSLTVDHLRKAHYNGRIVGWAVWMDSPGVSACL